MHQWPFNLFIKSKRLENTEWQSSQNEGAAGSSADFPWMNRDQKNTCCFFFCSSYLLFKARILQGQVCCQLFSQKPPLAFNHTIVKAALIDFTFGHLNRTS